MATVGQKPMSVEQLRTALAIEKMSDVMDGLETFKAPARLLKAAEEIMAFFGERQQTERARAMLLKTAENHDRAVRRKK